MASPSVVRPKSYTYTADVAWTGARAGSLTSAGKPALRVASPPEFRGEAGVWTPEDLFVASANICTMTTFLSFAERRGIDLRSYTSSAQGTLELVDGTFQFTKILIRPVLGVPAQQVADATQVMHEAHSKCLIANSMKCEVDVEPTVQPA
jgi:organic hydroperoxide reductase OsmC/OhrA